MRFNYSNINPNEQRLFPFVGGLVLGGVTGAFLGNNRYNQPYYYPMYYPPMYYQPPMYTTYNYTYTQSTANPPQVNIYNPYIADKIIYEDPIPLTFENFERNHSSNDSSSIDSLKNVPLMDEYRSDML